MKRGGYIQRIRKFPLRAKFAARRIAQTARRPKGGVALWRYYGLEQPAYVRYKGPKGVYWWLFSRKIRRRDFILFNGECIDQCGQRARDWRDMQAGHFVPASKGFTLLFDERNVNAQLPACNNPRISPLSPVGYARGLDLRYGSGTADALMAQQDHTTKGWSALEYDRRIRELLDDEKAAQL